MIYITKKAIPGMPKFDEEDLFFGETKLTWKYVTKSGTITRVYEDNKIPPPENLNMMGRVIVDFVNRYSALFEKNRASLYTTFYIPKRSGENKFRRIDAPIDELAQAMGEVKHILEDVCGGLHHTSAYAYVKGRSTVDAVKRHQAFESNWFLKTDFSDFFGSTTKNFVLNMFSMIYPFNFIMRHLEYGPAFEKMIDLCFLNGGLPQGTQASPTITNLMMVPIDFTMSQKIATRAFVYTRYADDILISAKEKFNYHEVVKMIREVLQEFNAPFDLKDSKTRFGSRCGSNWNLGVMLNKDNEITVGHMKKKYFKAAVCNFIMDHLNGKTWSPSDAQRLAGELSYYRMIEKDYFDQIIYHQNQKFHVDFEQMLKANIAGNLQF